MSNRIAIRRLRDTAKAAVSKANATDRKLRSAMALSELEHEIARLQELTRDYERDYPGDSDLLLPIDRAVAALLAKGMHVAEIADKLGGKFPAEIWPSLMRLL